MIVQSLGVALASEMFKTNFNDWEDQSDVREGT
jgi:hypothetical protein